MAREANFSERTKSLALARSGMVCECHLIPSLKRPSGCGSSLLKMMFDFDHIIPEAISKDNSLENCAVIVKRCHREKTKLDAKIISKTRRIRKKNGN